MSRIKEILRLHYVMNLSVRIIAASTGVAKSTVVDYLQKANNAGIDRSNLSQFDIETLERMLFPEQPNKINSRPMPDFQIISEELSKKGVTLTLLWEEYIDDHPNGYKFTQFCKLYKDWAKAHGVSMRQTHKAGEKMFLDFAGTGITIKDMASGGETKAELFVAVLGASNYVFAKAVPSQSTEHWVGANISAFEYFGGVTDILVTDNLKAAVVHASRYDAEINRTYLEMAKHYNTVIIPARARKPKDKPKAESAVYIVTTRIIASLRNFTFFSLQEANKAIHEKLTELNNRPMQKLNKSRLELFQKIDKPSLKPLPINRFKYAEWMVTRIPKDYHIDVKEHFYSVPYQLVGQKVEVKITDRLVEIICRDKSVATHARSLVPGASTTRREHMPKSHQAYAAWSRHSILEAANLIGLNVRKLCAQIFETSAHEQIALRKCSGILKLNKEFGADRLDAAAARGVASGALKLKNIRSILMNGLDRQPLDERIDTEEQIEHENIRGAEYYG